MNSQWGDTGEPKLKPADGEIPRTQVPTITKKKPTAEIFKILSTKQVVANTSDMPTRPEDGVGPFFAAP